MAQNVYESRRQVWVTPYTGSAIKYGFLSNVASAVGTSCGHNPITGALPTGLVFGANAPKPGRASKRRTNGVDSTFYDIGSATALRAGGWALSRPFIRRGRAGAASRAVFVNIADADGGAAVIKYAWNMTLHTYTKIAADRAGLGIEDATGNEEDLVWGLRPPKPPKARRTTVSGDSADTVTTYCDPTRTDSLPAGWGISGREYR